MSTVFQRTLLVIFLLSSIFPAWGAEYLTGPGNPIPLNYFGMHMHRIVALQLGGQRSNWPDFPFGSWRLWDAGVQWQDIEKSRGKFNFMVLDAYVNAAAFHDVDILYTLGGTPSWASARPDEKCPYGNGCAAEPRDLQDWESYVRQVAQRYKGRIKYYEMWNEPKFEGYDWDARVTTSFFTGTLKEFLLMAEVAQRVIHEVDPSAKLMGPADVGDGPRMAFFLKQGGARWIDEASFHFYSLTPELIPRKFRLLKDALAATGSVLMRLWNTETGFDPPKPGNRRDDPKDAEEHAGYVSRSLILGAASGLERFYWYSWEANLSSDGGRASNASGRAYGQTVNWLAGTRIKSCNTADERFWFCELARGQRKAWLIWSARGRLGWSPPSEWGLTEVQHLDGSITSPERTLNVGATPMLLKTDHEVWELSK